MTTTLRNPIWISLICRECGEPFGSIDPDRKWCDAHLVERVNGAGLLEEDDADQDDLFAERTLECQGCGATFTATSPRPADRCVECNAGLKVKVVCPVCDIPHVVALLAPHKLCKGCSVDLVMTLAGARVRLDEAHELASSLSARLDADVAHAGEKTRERFESAIAMLATGSLGERALSPDQVRAAWDKALARGDDLSLLLAFYDAAAAAALAQQRASAAVEAVEEAIE